MSFADPLTISLSGTPYTLPRVSVEGDKVVYATGDRTVIVTVDHDYGRRNRHVLRIDTKKVSPDPYRDDENVELTMSFYMVFDVPKDGYSAAEALVFASGLTAMATASSNANFTKLLNGES